MKKILRSISIILFSLFIGNLLIAQNWVGSEACKTCHSSKYNTWIESGHPYKFTVIQNGVPPEYPPEAINYQSEWIENLGDGTHTWNDIAGVIGGYGWKARFVGQDGHVIGTAGSSYSTGYGHNQINFFGGVNYGWVDYNKTSQVIYNYSCFKCHTTGGTTDGTWLQGVEGLGNFTEQGIGCESCHGPGGNHIAAPSSSNIDKVYEFAHLDNSSGGLSIDGVVQTPNPNGNDVNFLCGTCHNRSYTSPINSKNGFIEHHEQWDEFVATSHFENEMNCSTCHDPHKRVIWDGDGITMTCGSCHSEQVNTINHSSGATCIDCHMAYAVKSGTTRGQSGYMGDVRSHLMKIIPDTASMFTADGSNVRDDDERPAALSPAYSCLGCHNFDPNDDIPDKTLEEAVAGAIDMHGPSVIAEVGVKGFGVYPNPSSGPVNISFTLKNQQEVTVTVYDVSGKIIYLKNEFVSAGRNTIVWNGNSKNGLRTAPGYYLVKVSTAEASAVKKIILR